jgi:hypothetical protein
MKKVHIVKQFIARVGRTVCGRLSNNVTAKASEATCKSCQKLRG